MPSLGMEGPYSLELNSINSTVTRVSPGNYALGYTNPETNRFVVKYVGRSDTDVKGRLISWLGNTSRPQFKYCYASSPKTAFEKECRNWHDFNPEDNTAHPAKPSGANWACPVCAA